MIRIHSIEITDVAGTAHRRVEFDDITIVRGDNEVGKTTLMTALDVLLHSLDNSVAGPVKAITPKHRDAAPQIRADITVGDHRFTYFKRFAVRSFPGRTEAAFAEPEAMAGRTLTGRDAHDKVAQLLGEHTDVALWKALWVQQTGAITLPELQGRAAVLQAVDAAAGLVVDSNGSEDDSERRNTTIMDAVTGQYLKYYTKTKGDFIKEHKDAAKAAEQAEQQLAAAEQAARDVETWVAEHASASRKLAQARNELGELQPRLDELTGQAAVLEKAAEAVAALEREAKTADGQASSVQQLLDIRHRLVADTQTAAAAETAAAKTAQAAAQAAETAKLTADGAEDELPGLAAAADASGARLIQARTALELLRDTEELARVRIALEHIDTHAPQLRQLDDDLASVPAVDAADLAAIETAAAAEATARAVLEADSPRLTIEALTDIAITGLVDDGVHLTAGETRQWPLTAQTTVTAADAVRVTVTPGTSENDRRQAVAKAAQKLRALCEATGVPNAAAARTAAAHRADISARAGALRAGIDAVLAGRSETDIRAQADRLQTRIARGTETAGPLPGTRAEVEQALDTATLHAEQDSGRHTAGVAAAQALRETARSLDADARIAAGNLATAKASARERAAALQSARDKETDTDLAERARESADAATAAEDRWRQALVAYDSAARDRITAELATVRAAASGAAVAIRTMEDLRLEMNTRLQQAGDVHEAHTRATEARDRLVGDYQAMRGRAEAAKMLYETLTAARASARTVYTAPYKKRLEALAGIAFGRPVTLDLDENLTVTARTMDGATVDFQYLSGGAKEQLAVCARLAFASLVSKSSGLVPVIVDDALGYTDDERMENIDRVFNAARTGCQVIILTCTRKRYAGVVGAATVELTR